LFSLTLRQQVIQAGVVMAIKRTLILAAALMASQMLIAAADTNGVTDSLSTVSPASTATVAVRVTPVALTYQPQLRPVRALTPDAVSLDPAAQPLLSKRYLKVRYRSESPFSPPITVSF
jgi:hypothetical protein